MPTDGGHYSGSGSAQNTFAAKPLAARLHLVEWMLMAWTEAKTAISVGIGVLLVAGVITMVLWLGDSHERAQAKGERLIKKQVAKPIPLTNDAALNLFWPVPKGFQTFNNVPLRIDGMIKLWGEGGASKGMVYPKEVRDIPMYETFETLYIYHGSAYGSPPGTPVFEVVFRYVDDTSVTNRLLFGTDMLDWFCPGGTRVKGPTGPNSKVAWIGQMQVGNGAIQQLRYCMTAIENPKPTVKIWSMDLYSCQNRTVASILAMTTGKSGLMDDATPTDDRGR